MAWVRLDDSFSEHPKVHKVGPLGVALFVRLLCYANRSLLNGNVPERQVKAEAMWCTDMGELGKPKQLIESLVAAVLLEPIADGYHIHDYEKYQPLRDEVLAERELATSAKAIGGRARAATASRIAGRFASETTSNGTSAHTSEPTSDTSKNTSTPPAADQLPTSPVPVPVPDPDPVSRDVCKQESVE